MNNHFLIDTAIKNEEDDFFNFKHYAKKVKFLIQNRSANSESFTLGIYGKWGEGKTSFLNLIINEITSDHNTFLYSFNPWRYSTEDEMIFDYFDGLSKRIGIETETKIQKVGTWIEKYSKYLKFVKSPLSIPGLEINPADFFKTLGEDLKGGEVTIEKIKNIVNDSIKEANFKVIVIIDDLDRLDKNEIYAILKLIKLNANFDNFIFITTLDSKQIAKAIKDRYGNKINDGYSFLEKIINIPIHLPRIEKEDLNIFFKKNLDKILSSFSFLEDEVNSKISRSITYDINTNIIFKSPREIIRILNSYYISAFSIGEEVNLEDLFWVEYLKIKDSDCYNYLKKYDISQSASNQITFEPNPFSINFNINNLQSEREILIEKFEKSSWILEKIFPKNSSNSIAYKNPEVFYNELRICSAEHYEKYFSYHLERKIPKKAIEEIKKLLETSNTNELEELLKKYFQFNTIKTIRLIENLFIEYKDQINKRDSLFKSIIKTINHIPEKESVFSNFENRIQLIERIATILKNENSSVIQELAMNMDFYLLKYFIDFFDNQKELKNLFIKRSKDLINDKPKFYKTEETKLVNDIFYILNENEKNYLNEYIESNINEVDEIKDLIVSLSPKLKGKTYTIPDSDLNKNHDYIPYQGSIDQKYYNDIRKKINVDILYKKIKEKGIDKQITNTNYSNINKSTMSNKDENLEQFIYWYKLENQNQ